MSSDFILSLDVSLSLDLNTAINLIHDILMELLHLLLV